MSAKNRALSPIVEGAVKGLEEHFARENRDSQKSVLVRLKRVLDFFDETFAKEPGQRRPEHRDWPLFWPTKEDFSELDDLVFWLARSLRKKPLHHDDAYTIVAERWPRLKLEQFCERLLGRISSSLRCSSA